MSQFNTLATTPQGLPPTVATGMKSHKKKKDKKQYIFNEIIKEAIYVLLRPTNAVNKAVKKTIYSDPYVEIGI